MASMTPRERWLAYLHNKPVDRLPTDFWSTWEVRERIHKDLCVDSEEAFARKLSIDVPRNFGPRQLQHTHPDDSKADIWGVRHENVNYGTGAYGETVFNPLAHVQSVDDVHAFRWPDANAFDYAPMANAIGNDDGYRIRKAGGYEPFLLYCAMRGMEQAYEDLLVNEEIAHAILGHIFDFYYTINRRMFETGAGRIDVMYLAEDLGSQTGPLVSLDTYRKFLYPNQRKMADLARSFGIHVFYHTDGAAAVFLPDLVNRVGIEVLNPIQWRCPTMERETLARDFGKKVIFHGAIDNQYTLPFGTPDEVRQQVQETARLFKGCRWICAPCHNIQPNTPTANILAMYEEAARVQWP